MVCMLVVGVICGLRTYRNDVATPASRKSVPGHLWTISMAEAFSKDGGRGGTSYFGSNFPLDTVVWVSIFVAPVPRCNQGRLLNRDDNPVWRAVRLPSPVTPTGFWLDVGGFIRSEPLQLFWLPKPANVGPDSIRLRGLFLLHFKVYLKEVL